MELNVDVTAAEFVLASSLALDPMSTASNELSGTIVLAHRAYRMVAIKLNRPGLLDSSRLYCLKHPTTFWPGRGAKGEVYFRSG